MRPRVVEACTIGQIDGSRGDWVRGKDQAKGEQRGRKNSVHGRDVKARTTSRQNDPQRSYIIYIMRTLRE